VATRPVAAIGQQHDDDQHDEYDGDDREDLHPAGRAGGQFGSGPTALWSRASEWLGESAEKTGIGRATLYKYFPDVEAILLAWHERQIASHLEYLAEVRDQASDAGARLEAVLEAYALISHESHGHHDAELAAFLHRDVQVANAQHQLRDMIRELLTKGAESGELRDDVAADELASYCLHALSAASTLPSKAAVRRLVKVTLDGLRSGA
jgi:AcrR family transcriptional regulator